MTPYKKSFGQWVSVGESLPTTDGKYMCKIERAGDEIEALRLLKGNHWFGGCRPFSDNDVVVAWYRHTVFSIILQKAENGSPYYELALQLGITIEALIGKEVSPELYVEVIQDRSLLEKMITPDTPATVIEMANRFLNMDSKYYSIVLTAPLAVLSEHLRSCATS
ncbi:hypothetical protein HPY09_19910 (plasmid) [Vibrio cholerae]|uniref:hypothetical protein n=1 Tax=Vibrio cholerae TaxID=666 RepID=UPI0011D8DC6A|nr:hypothetical protein [Vibrio cholerae]EJL6462628.1 hypothetical protein [Vibrio cholerae]MBJ6954111.1 hypothetical protein [Vibrio cholerae]MVC22188.1 hypothetical protein [Vibrio cholerae]QKU73211.1 hypothetical protein HPY09_19910 [Vibrio cholerae]QKU77201.1 hypothetical protein HPY05_20105 [Vibrio cholerae]